jgi:putative phosphoserine phosphatase/1-acylglycerol-3-phosphate O-acyltransferase
VRRPARPTGTRPAADTRHGATVSAAVAEIDASPAGAGIAAIVDFDGTLIPGYSVATFIEDRIRRGEMGLDASARLAMMLVEAFAGATDNRDLIVRGFSEWAGHPVRQLEETGQRLFAAHFEENIYPEMRAIIEAHQRKAHTVVLASSAVRFQVEPTARHLGIEHLLCTRLAVRKGRFTGELDGPVLWGTDKAEAVRDFASRHGIDLRRSYFYADGDEDQALMHLVGHPRPTNPQPQLARVAARRGWPVQRFTSRGRVSADARVRNLLATAMAVPAVLGAAAVRLLTGDKREAANLLTSTLMDYWVALGGVKLNVIGEEHLWSHRPAVFIFNHRNNFDAQIMGKLVRRDFGVVAKKELKALPIFAIGAKFLHIAFIDRDDPRKAVEALQPGTQLLKEGISMILAPEGRRVVGRGLADFKKGAFRMALAARVPIVPVVFRNADEVGPRSSAVMRPATVDVAVLPPVPTDDWSLETLDRHIAQVRQMFVDTLENWPGAAGA